MSVFCDWLTVSAPSDSSLVDSVKPLLDELPVERREDGKTTHYRCSDGRGLLHVTEASRWHRLSASGGFLATLRAHSLFREYLGLLSCCPSLNVTRLDAALDQPRDAAAIIRRLHRKYRDGYAFTRKAVEQTAMLQTRLDGEVTGSVYLGTQDSTVSMRVYDKQHEAYAKRGEVLPPTLRWELTVQREVGATLRDADDPAPLFYHFMSPEFLDKPKGMSEWLAHGEQWNLRPAPARLPSERLASLLESSGDVARLIQLADDCGPEGRRYLLGLLRRRLGLSPGDSLSPSSLDAPGGFLAAPEGL
jgi:hypothetical protein